MLRALDEANDLLSRTTVEGEGDRKKGTKFATDAERKATELEGVLEKAKKVKQEFSDLEETANDVSCR